MNHLSKDFIETSLKNTDAKNPKLMILFSGVPGSGKSTFAKRLESDLRGIRIERDTIRDYFRGKNDDRFRDNDFINECYLELLEAAAQSSNGLLINDASIDRRYAQVIDTCNNLNYRWLTICLKLDRESLVKRNLNRGGRHFPAENYISFLDKWIDDQRKFEAQFGDQIDLCISTKQPQDEVYAEIYSLVAAHLEKLKA